MGIATMVSEISKAVKRRDASGQSVRRGVLSGNQVLVDGQYYPAAYAVDVDVDDGERVYVMLDNRKATAVVVGK